MHNKFQTAAYKSICLLGPCSARHHEQHKSVTADLRWKTMTMMMIDEKMENVSHRESRTSFVHPKNIGAWDPCARKKEQKQI